VFALLASLVWGSTYASSKVLLNAGMGPAEIMVARFVIAYVVMLALCHRDFFTSWRQESRFALMGLLGGTLYFLSENKALEMTSSTSTVALIVCTAPVVTALVGRLIWRSEKLSPWFMLGSLIALAGTALVVFNGIFILDDNPWVVVLSLSASLCWALYSAMLRVLEKGYSSMVITRKLFFWGIATMLPYIAWDGWHVTCDMLQRGDVLFNVIFLALVASLGCFLLWSIVTRRIGVVTASNYLYFCPAVALVTASIVLSEVITIYAIIGCVVTIVGVYLCNRRSE